MWDRQLQQFQAYLVKLHTNPDIIHFLITGLTSFKKHPSGQDTHGDTQWERDQTRIGWFNLFSGFLSRKLVAHQQAHFKLLRNRNSGKIWASMVIQQLWMFLLNMWTNRNEVLHRKESINSMSGGLLLDIEVEREHDIGCNDLPPVVHKWFRITKTQLLDSSTEYKKGWLLIVKSVKEAMQVTDYSIFTSSCALRRWVGLPNLPENTT